MRELRAFPLSLLTHRILIEEEEEEEKERDLEFRFQLIFVFFLLFTHLIRTPQTHTDLFKKGFVTGAGFAKITTNVNTSTGVSFKTESTKSGSSYGTKLSVKGFTQNGMSLDKFEVTAGNVVAETSFSDNGLVPNAVFSAKTSLKQGGPTFGCVRLHLSLFL